jgi:hypothetical protein
VDGLTLIWIGRANLQNPLHGETPPALPKAHHVPVSSTRPNNPTGGKMTSQKDTEKQIARALHDTKMNGKVRRDLNDRICDKSITRAGAAKAYKERTGKDW